MICSSHSLWRPGEAPAGRIVGVSPAGWVGESGTAGGGFLGTTTMTLCGAQAFQGMRRTNDGKGDSTGQQRKTKVYSEIARPSP
jgi:hypothetical protein